MYIASNINISSLVRESHDDDICEITSCGFTFEGRTFISGVIYPSPVCLTDDFILLRVHATEDAIYLNHTSLWPNNGIIYDRVKPHTNLWGAKIFSIQGRERTDHQTLTHLLNNCGPYFKVLLTYLHSGYIMLCST